ncbi:hypothetical protein D6I70_03035 [Escherichia coli]|nr:hypothetical protein [Escherichia coli]
MKKKLISGLFLMLWMALLIAAMVYPQGIFPVLAASGVWVACLLTWAVIPVLEAGESRQRIALIFDVGVSTIYRKFPANKSNESP